MVFPNQRNVNVFRVEPLHLVAWLPFNSDHKGVFGYTFPYPLSISRRQRPHPRFTFCSVAFTPSWESEDGGLLLWKGPGRYSPLLRDFNRRKQYVRSFGVPYTFPFSLHIPLRLQLQGEFTLGWGDVSGGHIIGGAE